MNLMKLFKCWQSAEVPCNTVDWEYLLHLDIIIYNLKISRKGDQWADTEEANAQLD